jgi:hypothetical protein
MLDPRIMLRARLIPGRENTDVARERRHIAGLGGRFSVVRDTDSGPVVLTVSTEQALSAIVALDADEIATMKEVWTDARVVCRWIYFLNAANAESTAFPGSDAATATA